MLLSRISAVSILLIYAPGTSLRAIMVPFVAMAEPHSQSARQAPSDTVLFKHLNVVPMDFERVVTDEDVLVQNGTIQAIAKQIKAPAGAQIVDGHSTQFLCPGLADMHVHSDTRRDMILFLANGVTTVLNMGHARAGFVNVTRPAVNRGRTPGPHIYVSFMVDGSPENSIFFVRTPEEAHAVVRLAKTNGYDFIKVYNDLSPECFNALIEEGRAQGLGVIGHGVTRVGLEKQLATGQSMIAHIEEFFYTVFKYPSPQAESDNAAPTLDQIPSAIAFTKRYGAFVTADLSNYETIARQWRRPEELHELLTSPEMKFLAPDQRLAWHNSEYLERTSPALKARVEFEKKFISAMDRAGVPLLAGTDTPDTPGLVPGFSLHDDLQALQQTGMSTFAVLSTATRTPGEFIKKVKLGQPRFGTVAVGNRADLIVAACDPLKDLSCLRAPVGVMASGHWYAVAQLKDLIEDVAKQYRDAIQVQ